MNHDAYSLAWLAGAVDGEGTIGIYHNKGPRSLPTSFHPVFRICCIDEVFILEIDRVLRTLGLQYPPRKYKAPNARQGWCWHIAISKRKALQVLYKALIPYLVLKRRNAAISLEFLEAEKRRPRAQETLDRLYLEIRSINQRTTQSQTPLGVGEETRTPDESQGIVQTAETTAVA